MMANTQMLLNEQINTGTGADSKCTRVKQERQRERLGRNHVQLGSELDRYTRVGRKKRQQGVTGIQQGRDMMDVARKKGYRWKERGMHKCP